MKRFQPTKILGTLVFCTAFGGLMGFVIMALWNATLPLLVRGVSVITFWQSLALLVLSRLLFGGFRAPWGQGGFGRPERGRWKQNLAERWRQMTPEQRDQLKQRWGGHCGKGWRTTQNTPPDKSSIQSDNE